MKKNMIILACLIFLLVGINTVSAQYTQDLDNTLWRILYRENGYVEYGLVNFADEQIILSIPIKTVAINGYFSGNYGVICSIHENDIVRCFQIRIDNGEMFGRFTLIDLNNSTNIQYSTITGVQIDLNKSDHFIEPYINPNSIDELPPTSIEQEKRSLPDHGICFISLLKGE